MSANRMLNRLCPALLVLILSGVIQTAHAADLMESALAANEATYAKIKSVSYEVVREIAVTAPGEEPFRDAMFGSVLQSGGNRRVTLTATNRVIEMQTEKRLPPVRVIRQTLESDGLIVLRADASGNAIAKAYKFAAGSEPPAEALADSETQTGKDDILYAFGTGSVTLREMIRNDIKNSRLPTTWQAREAQDTDGRPLVVLDRTKRMPNGQDFRQSETVLDPAKGHAITRTTSFNEAGSPLQTRKMTVKEVAPGIWVPVRVEIHRTVESALGSSPKPGQDLAATYLTEDITLTGIHLNGAIAADAFTLSGLGIPDRRTVFVHENGNPSEFVYVDGELIPRADADKRDIFAQDSIRVMR